MFQVRLNLDRKRVAQSSCHVFFKMFFDQGAANTIGTRRIGTTLEMMCKGKKNDCSQNTGKRASDKRSVSEPTSGLKLVNRMLQLTVLAWKPVLLIVHKCYCRAFRADSLLELAHYAKKLLQG